MSASDPDVALVETAPDPYTAEVLVGFLKAEGIPAFVRGAELEDMVAASERALHVMGCRVYAPAERLEEARRLIQSGREAGRFAAEGEPAGEHG